MNETAPQIHYQENLISPEVREKYEAMTEEEAAEKIIESVERAQDLIAELKEYDKTDKDNNVIHIHDRAEWNEAKKLSRELKENLVFIPFHICAKNDLPFHPSEQSEKIQYKHNRMPEDPADSGYADKLEYKHKAIPESDRIEVDQMAETPPGVVKLAS